MFPVHEEEGTPPDPPIGPHDDSESPSLQALVTLAEQRQRRRQEEALRAEIANEQQRALAEREWNARRLRAEAARLEREHAAGMQPDRAPERRIEPTPPPRESAGWSESGPYTKAIAALMGAVFALVLLDSAYYVLVSQSRMVRLAEASRRMLNERSTLFAQMEHAVATERNKASTLSIELAEAHKTIARLEREITSARRERPRVLSAPAIVVAAVPTAPTIVVAAAPRTPPRGYTAPLDDTAKRPIPRPASAPSAPCQTGDPLCSNL